MDKKLIRKKFRNAVFNRVKYKCEVCNRLGFDRQEAPSKPNLIALDAHHITPREEFENGGYVLSNGISLCDKCHEIAEKEINFPGSIPEYSSKKLYKVISSSFEKAKADDRIN